VGPNTYGYRVVQLFNMVSPFTCTYALTIAAMGQIQNSDTDSKLNACAPLSVCWTYCDEQDAMIGAT